MAYTEQDILKALSNVKDPDLNKDLVSLKMIQGIAIEGNKISFTVVLTTPACPLKEQIKQDSIHAVKAALGSEVEVDVKIDARVTSKRENLENILPGVKNIVCVASGKGGVGKSTVAVNLALGLAQDGAKVGLLDADIYGPSIPTMFGLKGERPRVEEIDGKHYINPIEKFGIKLLSVGFLVEDKQAVVWRGPMVSSALRQFVTDCLWGELDYLILDLPPGTGDIHLTLVQTVPVTGAVVVTTPQEVALADARKAVGMFQMPQINVPVVGIVENMAYFTPEELPDNKYYIFGQGGGAKFAEDSNLPLLGEIPLVQGIREGGDTGVPAVLDGDSIVGTSFRELAVNTARHIAIRNAKHAPTKKVEVAN